MKSELRLPITADEFIASCKTYAENCISLGIWKGIDRPTFEQWWLNFVTLEDQYLAASILDRFIYRSSEQFTELLRQPFKNEKVLMALFPKGYKDDRHLINILQQNENPKILLVPVIKHLDPPTKSGPLVQRHITRSLKLNKRWAAWPFQIIDKVEEGECEAIIFIDDIVGTGEQFLKFVNSLGDKFEEILDKIPVVYLCATAWTKGIEKINDKYPKIIIAIGEELGAEQRFFEEEAWKFEGSDLTIASLKKHYEDLLQRLGISSSSYKYGHKKCAFTYGFEHGCPNNSLPLLWYDGSENFSPLLRR